MIYVYFDVLSAARSVKLLIKQIYDDVFWEFIKTRLDTELRKACMKTLRQ